MLMDLMVVITYIKSYDKRIGKKNHIPNKQENLKSKKYKQWITCLTTLWHIYHLPPLLHR